MPVLSRLAHSLGVISLLASCALFYMGCDKNPSYLDYRVDYLPDGSKLVFGSCASGNGDLALVNTDGSSLRTLTVDPSIEGLPNVSPDGKSIVYVVRAADSRTGQIYIMNADGTNRRHLIQSQFSDESPSYSPDGQKLLIVRAMTHRSYSMGGMKWDDWDLWETNVDDSQPRQLTNMRFYDIDPPYFSPDEKQIIFAATIHNASAHNIFRIDLKGEGAMSNPQKIEINQKPNISFIYDGQPRFSPDGHRIVFVSTRISRQAAFDYEIWTADSDGLNPKQITHNQSINSYPTFSPDGQFIAFMSDSARSNRGDLWKIRKDGSELIRLTQDGRGIQNKN